MRPSVNLQQDPIRIVVRLTPKASRGGIDGWADAADGKRVLKARVSAPPEGGKANAALIAMLAKALDVPPSAIAVARGETARIKHVVLHGDAARLRGSLDALGKAK
jgi:uncharacterized protein